MAKPNNVAQLVIDSWWLHSVPAYVWSRHVVLTTFYDTEKIKAKETKSDLIRCHSIGIINFSYLIQKECVDDVTIVEKNIKIAERTMTVQ